MSHCLLRELDARFTALYNDVATDVGLALFSGDENSIRTAVPDFVTPQRRRTLGCLIVSDNENSVVMGLVYDVVKAAQWGCSSSVGLRGAARLSCRMRGAWVCRETCC